METSSQNCESLGKIIDEGFPLDEVFLYIDDVETGFFDEVVLRFAETYIKISATLDDTIEIVEIGSTELKPLPLNIVSSSSFNVWSKCIGFPIRWSWAMENNKGYNDAFQLEFAQKVDSTSISIQLRAEASELTIYMVQN